MLKMLPLLLLSLCCTSLSVSEEKLKLPEFERSSELPKFKPQTGPVAIKPRPVLPPIKALSALSTIQRNPEKKRTPLKAGDPIPNVTLRDPAGGLISLPQYTFGKHTLLIFYRGSWCSYCHSHLREIKTIEGPLMGLGYHVIAISPDKPEILRETIKELKPAYDLLSDNSMAAAKAFGLAFTVDDDTLENYKKHDVDLQNISGRTHHMLPIPAVYLLSPSGTILYAYSSENYKVRISADELLKQANLHYRPVF